MKNSSIILIAALVVFQLCNNLWAKPITAEEVELVVTGWLKIDPQPLDTTLGQQIKSVEPFTDKNGQSVYYVTYLQPSGFVIVSADDLVEPIIGFADNGIFNPSYTNPLGALVTNDLKGRTEAVRDKISISSMTTQTTITKTQKKWSYLIDLAKEKSENIILMNGAPICDDNPSNVRIAPLTKSKWNQTWIASNQWPYYRACFNYYTPQILSTGALSWDKGDEYYGHVDNYYAGCTAIAMAQLMRYYEYPQEAPMQPDPTDPNNTIGVGEVDPNGEFVPLMPRLYRSLLGGDEIGGPYQWTQMVFEPNSSTTLEQIKAIGAICHDAGVAAKMNYTADGSSAGFLDAKEALINNFLYKNAIWGPDGIDNIGSALIGMIHPNLDAKRPVILAIHGDEQGGGHAVICDGYGYDSTETLYHHLNMGWSGSDDCWYNLPIIECQVTGYKYTTVYQCVYNVFKDSYGEIISGRVLNDDGTPAEGATVYRILSDGTEPCEVSTDSNGIYFFDNLDSDTTYTIWASIDCNEFPKREVVTGTSKDESSVSGNRWAVDFPWLQNMLYVDQQATAGNNDGSCWSDAFTDLQDALEATANSPGQVDEIWVADGTYRPDRNTGNRTLSFQLVDGVGIYGGFAGGETYREQRDPQTNLTTLTGDLNGDDGDSFTNNNENSYHVVNGSGTSASAILDGFTIMGGNASGTITNSEGGGMYIFGANPTVRHCLFRNNSAEWGGGIYNSNSSSTVEDCEFTGNMAIECGGGIENEYDSKPLVIGCTFIGNRAKFGAGLRNYNSHATVTQCEFINNDAYEYGGGMENEHSNPTVIDCTFNLNSAQWGGGLRNFRSDPTVDNCTFIDNSAQWSGGGLQNYESSPIMTNCVFRNNSTKWGGGLCFDKGCLVQMGNCTLVGNTASQNGGGIYIDEGSSITVTNCILWANTGRASEIVAHDEGTSVTISYCDIEDGLNGIGIRTWNGAPPVIDGGGNINANPLFADPNNGDYHLKSQAGRWELISESWIMDEVTSPCIDAGDPNSPIRDEPDPNGGIINMGVYGGTAEASKSPY
jgi:parallel beta-helix repeat protein